MELKNYSVQEMSTKEIKNTNGGGIIDVLIAIVVKEITKYSKPTL